MLFLWGCEMNEKMMIEKARELVESKTNKLMGQSETAVYLCALSFIEGHESRQPEIDELNKQIEELGYKLRVKLAEEVLREAR